MGRKRWLVIAVMFIANTINYADRVNISVAGQDIAATFGLGPEALGIILSCFFYSYIILLVPMGLLTDRIGPRAIMGGGMLLWAVGSAATGLAPNFASLVGARLLLGVGESSSYPAGNRALREWAPREERGMMAAIFHAGSTAGPAVGILLTTLLLSLFGWRMSFLIISVLTLAWALVWLFFYRSPEAATWLSEAERTHILTQRESDDADAIQPMSLRALLRQPAMWGLLITHGCQTYSLYLFLTWLPSYLRAVRHLDLFRAGWLATLPYVVTTIGMIFVGHVSDRLMRRFDLATGARRYLMIALMGAATCILFVPYADGLVTMEVLIVVSILLATAANSLNYALAGDLTYDKNSAGTVFSLLVLGGNGFGFVAPILTGFIIARTQQYTLSFVLAAALLLIGMAVSWLMVRRPLQPAPESELAPDAVHSLG
jgi:MFS family permease